MGVLLFIIVTIVALSLAAHLLTPLVPFSAEQKIADAFASKIKPDSTSPSHVDMTRYLQSLADRITKAQKLPDEMTIIMHYVETDTVNAFATLGGHVFFFRGLLEKIPDENTLAMVMAHEIAHIKYRHPIKTLGRTVITGTAIAAVNTAIGGSIISNVLGETGLLTTLKFSREQEQESDEAAMTALARIYGHVVGANTLFEILETAHKNGLQPPEFFSSHPHTGNRIENITALATMHQWSTTGAITPLPPHFKHWLKPAKD